MSVVKIIGKTESLIKLVGLAFTLYNYKSRFYAVQHPGTRYPQRETSDGQRTSEVDDDVLLLLPSSHSKYNYQNARGPQVPFVILTPGGSKEPEAHGTPEIIWEWCRFRKAGRIGCRMFTSGAAGSSENFSQQLYK